jgi:hypothetical protein
MQAKYVDRKGFLVNHLKGTITEQCSVSTSLIDKPEKKAAGRFFNRYKRNFAGLLIKAKKAA